MIFYCVCFLVFAFIVEAMAFPADKDAAFDHPVMSCVSSSRLTTDNIQMAVSSIGPIGDEQYKFVKCVMIAADLVSFSKNVVFSNFHFFGVLD